MQVDIIGKDLSQQVYLFLNYVQVCYRIVITLYRASDGCAHLIWQN